MIKVKLLEVEKHRNETTFRPYIQAQHALREIGIEFVDGDTYDYAWVGQASIADKKLPLLESVERGLEFCSKITGDYLIFDGQDSHSLLGTYEVFKDSNAELLLKNTLLREWAMYRVPTANGRWYWGPGNYSVPDIDMHSDRIVLSGTNWLHTAQVKFFDYGEKKHDVCALFGYPWRS